MSCYFSHQGFKPENSQGSFKIVGGKSQVDLPKYFFLSSCKRIVKMPLPFECSKLVFDYLLPQSVIVGVLVNPVVISIYVLLVFCSFD